MLECMEEPAHALSSVPKATFLSHLTGSRQYGGQRIGSCDSHSKGSIGGWKMKPGATHGMFHFPEDGGEDSPRGLISCKAHLTEARTIVTDEGRFFHCAVVTWTHLWGEITSSLISAGTALTAGHVLCVPTARLA